MKIKKIIPLIISICFILTSFCSCAEDLAREQYTEDISVEIEAEPTSIVALEPEIELIAHEYDEDGELVEVFATFKNDEIAMETGTISFSYTSEVEEQSRVTVVIITYDMETRTATQVSFDEGNGVFVDTTDTPIEETVKQVTFSALFEQIRDDASMSAKLSGENVTLTIEFTQDIECKIL